MTNAKTATVFGGDAALNGINLLWAAQQAQFPRDRALARKEIMARTGVSATIVSRWVRGLVMVPEKYCAMIGLPLEERARFLDVTLEGALQRLRTAHHHVCISDTTDSETFRRSGAWFLREVYTIFLTSRYDTRTSQRTYQQALQECREMRRQIISRLLKDEIELRQEMLFLDIDSFRSRDLGGYFLDAHTGLYFMVAFARPLDLTFKPAEWSE